MSDASAAIEDAREAYESGDYAAAVTTLEGALKLGGSGTKRDRAKPAELSMGELQAVWYNLTACWSTLGDVDKAIASLEKTLKAGFCSAELYGFNKANEDYNALMSDEGDESRAGGSAIQGARGPVQRPADGAATSVGPVAVVDREGDQNVGR